MIPGFIAGIAEAWGKWIMDRLAGMIIDRVTDTTNLETLCEAIDGRVDGLDKNMPEIGKATRKGLLAFSDKLRENLTEPD